MGFHSTTPFFSPFKKVLEAMTATTAGEKFSLERLEMLGDSCLKFAVSCHFFQKNPKDHEGMLTVQRRNWINNEKLLSLALNKGIKVSLLNSVTIP